MHGFVVSLAQSKGGVGKSTLAAQLAVACATRGYRVQVIDIDRQATLVEWATLRQGLGSPFIDNVDVQQGSAWRLPYILQRLSSMADLLFIDGASGRSDDFNAMMRAADLVLLPCQPTAPDLWATQSLLESHHGLSAKSLVVLNRVPPRSKAASQVRQSLSKMSCPLAQQSIGNRQAYAATMGVGLGVMEVEPSSLAGQEINALAAEIVERHSETRLVA